MEKKTMRKATLCFLLLPAVLLLTVNSFADTTINNFDGYNDHWYGFGDKASQTYGELFQVPTNGDSVLTSFSFYLGDALPDPLSATAREPIITGAYIATWSSPNWINGHAQQLLFSSPQITYDNKGKEELTVNTSGLPLQIGQNYVIFLSTSQYHGQSSGGAYAVEGDPNQYLHGFAYANNGDFNDLFTTNWAVSEGDDWAVNLHFDAVPEPSSLVLLGAGILGGIGVLRRKLAE
jgi:PEP-CTERM motif